MIFMSPLLRGTGKILSKDEVSARLAILIFHRVLPEPDPYLRGTLDASGFSAILRTLDRVFNVLPLLEALERLEAGDLPPCSVSITFDDGYADNVEVALPLLQGRGMHATFFIATSYLDGGVMWNDCIFDIFRHTAVESLDLEFIGLPNCSLTTMTDRRYWAEKTITALKYKEPRERDLLVEHLRKCAKVGSHSPLMMTVDQLRSLHDAGMTIGAHTKTHPILSRLTLEEARDEISGSRQLLEELLDTSIRCFAYPNGKPDQDYTSREVTLVREAGFQWAFSTAWGVATVRSDPLQIPRFTPWDRNMLLFSVRLIANYRNVRAHMARDSISGRAL